MYYTFPPIPPYQGLILPVELADRLSSMNEDEVKILLLLHAYAVNQKQSTLEESAVLDYLQNMGYSNERSRNALAYLRGAQLIDDEKTVGKKRRTAPAKERAYYSGEQLAQAAEGSEEFKALRDYAEKKLGKLFNTSELSTLYSFTDSLCFTSPVVMLVIEYCLSVNKGSLRYVEKMLVDLSDKGLTDYEAVEHHIAAIKEYQSYEGKIRTLCGLKDRALTKRETAMVARWKNELKVELPLLELAYEKTVNAIQRPSLTYMGSILEAWAAEGITTPEQVQEKRSTPASPDKKSKSFDTDEFFRAAVEKSRGKI